MVWVFEALLFASIKAWGAIDAHHESGVVDFVLRLHRVAAIIAEKFSFHKDHKSFSYGELANVLWNLGPPRFL